MNHAPSLAVEAHKDYTGAKIAMWLFLFTELLLFTGMFLLYSVYRSINPQDFHLGAGELNTALGTANTLILLASSLSMALSIAAVRKGHSRQSVLLVLTTIALGCVFLVVKYFEWMEHIREGVYPNSPVLLAQSHGKILFFGLYYVMTGFHGLHVLAGVVLLTVMAAMISRGGIHQGDFVKLENSGLYWHLVDIIWIYLFPLFYLIT